MRVTIDEDVFYFNGECQYHREDGPAIVWANGDKVYYQNDKLHRIDGPAIDCIDGHKEWYIHGKKYSKKEYLAATKK